VNTLEDAVDANVESGKTRSWRDKLVRESVTTMKTKHHAPAAERNKDPILNTIRDCFIDPQFLTKPQLVLTIAEGSGQHVVHFAKHLPYVEFQPTDVDPAAMASISAYIEEARCKNIRPPLVLDAASEVWPVEHADMILCINMIHISPWSSAEGLFKGAARILPSDALLITYGPYRFSGKFTAPSNKEFDESLRARNPEWGVRDVDDLQKLAGSVGFDLEWAVPLPANNHCLIFHKA
jgi:Protein of unknown function (DUF938)